jgi:hypothetical protein
MPFKMHYGCVILFKKTALEAMDNFRSVFLRGFRVLKSSASVA